MRARKAVGQDSRAGSAARWIVASVTLAVAVSPVTALRAQSTLTWNPLTNGSAWLNSDNWTGGSGGMPGVDGNANSLIDGNAGDIATFGSLGFAGASIGINMAPSGNSGISNNTGAFQFLSLGALDWRSTTRAITLGKSDNTTATSTLRLNGATVTPGALPINNVLVSISNAATQDFTIANTVPGGTGTMDLQLGITNGAFYVNTGRTLAISSKITEAAAGSGFQKIGGGTLTLSGANTFTGTVDIQAGVLSLGNSLALGAAAGATVVESGAALSLKNGVVVGSETVSIKGTGGGATAGNSNGALQAAAGATGIWAGNIILDDAAARIGAGNGGTLIVSGSIMDGLSNTLTIGAGLGGSGTVTLSGVNTYTGNTNITRGTLKLGADNALPTTTILDVDSTNAAETAAFDLDGYNQTLSGLSRGNPAGGGGSLVITSAVTPSTLTLNQAIDTEFSGAITGAINIAKSGTGTLRLTGSTTFNGTTTVSGGTLAVGVSGLGGTSAITVDGGGTLLLTGSGDRVSDLPSVTLAGGTLSMEGLTAETEDLGGLILAADSTIDFGSGSANTLRFGNLSLGGFTLTILNWSGSHYFGVNADTGANLAQDRLLFLNDPGISGVSADLRFYADGGSTFIGEGKQVLFGGDYEIVPIPEPGTLFAAAGLVGLIGWRERRRLAGERRP